MREAIVRDDTDPDLFEDVFGGFQIQISGINFELGLSKVRAPSVSLRYSLLEIRMSTQLEIIEAQALSLAAEERAQLADRLIASLFDDQDIEEAWAVEVECRIKDIESGRAKLIPAAEAIARARAAIK